ncbi:MAG TPA: DUF488 domain-containing protein [Rhodanobacteraceae bacterium]|nr:DUF488 domain-containing protein [Rhodanobacteraceae bacterium]
MPLPGTTWTIGHSTRSLEEFLALLAGNRIEALADVRRFPGSRKYPHFNADELARALREAGIEYAPFPELGGRRKPAPDSRNGAWRNAAFRGYADYMETAEFRRGMERLIALADGKRTAVMCSEAVWWRCHRRLISDWFQARGVRVLHILDAKHVVEHPPEAAPQAPNGDLDHR